MKIILTTFLLCFISAGIVSAQKTDDEQKLKSTVDLIFHLCEEGKYDSIAVMIIYTGKDQERYFKDTYNYSERKEANTVKRMGKKIKAFIDLSDSRRFGKYSTTEEDGVPAKNLEVIFINGEQELVNVFTFVEMDNKLLLLKFQ